MSQLFFYSSLAKSKELTDMAAPRETQTSEAEEYFWHINIELDRAKSGRGILLTVTVVFRARFYVCTGALATMLWKCGITTTVTD